MTPRVAVYSAIYGDYEATAKPLPPGLPCPAVMFTDQAEIARSALNGGWRTVLSKAPYEHFEANPANGDPEVVRPMLAHKFWKTHPVEAMWTAANEVPSWPVATDVSIWLDGSMEISVDGQTFVDRCVAALGEDDWSVMPHPWRNCIFDEAVYSSTLIFRYDGAAMMRQHDRYADPPWSHPRGWGLFATGHMVRRHNGVVRALGQDWWFHNINYSHQDQLSLPPLMRHYADPETAGLGHDRAIRWNCNLPWGELWHLHPHGA